MNGPTAGGRTQDQNTSKKPLSSASSNSGTKRPTGTKKPTGGMSGYKKGYDY